jgi:hypothetical protein
MIHSASFSRFQIIFTWAAESEKTTEAGLFIEDL